jgi:hypothetical protein
MKGTQWAALVIMAIVLAACARQLTPAEQLAQSVADAKAACEQACQQGAAQAEVVLPENATLYTTTDSMCVRYGARLFCGTCGCGISESVNLTGPATIACAFTKDSTGTAAARCGMASEK